MLEQQAQALKDNILQRERALATVYYPSELDVRRVKKLLLAADVVRARMTSLLETLTGEREGYEKALPNASPGWAQHLRGNRQAHVQGERASVRSGSP